MSGVAEVREDFTPEWDDHLATTGRYGEFCAAHGTAVYRIARGILRQEEDAEEVAADAFARAYQTYTEHRAAHAPLAQPLVPFLYRVARNRAIDVYRARGRRPPQVPFPDDEHGAGLPVSASEPGDDERELLAIVRACIAALPSPHREVYARYYLDCLSLDEVADDVGIPYERVRGILKSAREQIGRLLAPHLLEDALADVAVPDRALLQPYYRPPVGGARVTSRQTATTALFEQARLRLIARLLRWEILFQRLPPEEYRALAAYVPSRSWARAAESVTAFRREQRRATWGVEPPSCTPSEARVLVDRAIAWLDRRLWDSA